MSLIEYLDSVADTRMFMYIGIAVIILFIFTQIVEVKIGHAMALIISLGLLYYLNERNRENISNFNEDIEFKIKSLSDNPPSHFYLDPDIVNLFSIMKNDFRILNKDAYLKAIETANNMLILKDQITSKGVLRYADNFEIAEDMANKSLNYIHSFIYQTPGGKVINEKHEKLLGRAQILFRRNLDAMKAVCQYHINKNINSSTRFITTYGVPKPYDKTKHTFEYY